MAIFISSDYECLWIILRPKRLPKSISKIAMPLQKIERLFIKTLFFYLYMIIHCSVYDLPQDEIRL